MKPEKMKVSVLAGVGEGAVDEQIRVAADGRGEVGVVGLGEAVVAETFRRVDGALEGAEQGDLQGVAVGPARQEFEDFLDFAALGEVACLDAVGQQKLAIFLQAGFVRHLVDPIKGGTMLAVEVAGDGLVGEEHELLNELVGFVRRLFLDPVRAAAFVEEDAELGKIEIESAAGKAPLTQGGGKGPGFLQKAVEIVHGRTMKAELGFLVGETVAGKDDGPGEAGGGRADPHNDGWGR